VLLLFIVLQTASGVFLSIHSGPTGPRVSCLVAPSSLSIACIRAGGPLCSPILPPGLLRPGCRGMSAPIVAAATSFLWEPFSLFFLRGVPLFVSFFAITIARAQSPQFSLAKVIFILRLLRGDDTAGGAAGSSMGSFFTTFAGGEVIPGATAPLVDVSAEL
jgi:hypothetical protein